MIAFYKIVLSRWWAAFLFFLCITSVCTARPFPILAVNPLQYGLKEAQNGIGRYYVLLECHKDAINKGLDVNYKGIDTIRLEMPKDVEPIPLSINTDFAGVVLIVLNTQKELVLFRLRNYLAPHIINTDLSHYDSIWDGNSYLVSITDINPWVDNRIGYDYGHCRSDLIYIKKGKRQNNVITPYNLKIPSPKYEITVIDDKPRSVKNLIFIRDEKSTCITGLIQIHGYTNVFLQNIRLYTPPSYLYGDAAIQIEYSANIKLKNVIIDGTYSQKDKYGYGIVMENVWNVTFDKLEAHGNWGVFGCNDVNKVQLKNCNINRFDIHCYGKDIIAERCVFSNLYNQVSSVYGSIVFNKCTFKNFVPMLIESSYNAYTQFDLRWEKCVFYFNLSKNYLLTLSTPPTHTSCRSELAQKKIPNIYLKNCKVYLEDDVNEWYIVESGGARETTFDNSPTFVLENIKVFGNESIQLKLFSDEIKSIGEIHYYFNKITTK